MPLTLYKTFEWQTFASLRLFTCLLYVSTYCVPIAHLRQNKPFPLLYLWHAQIILPLALMASESIAHSAFGLMGYWLRAHSGSGIIVKYMLNQNQYISSITIFSNYWMRVSRMWRILYADLRRIHPPRAALFFTSYKSRIQWLFLLIVNSKYF